MPASSRTVNSSSPARVGFLVFTLKKLETTVSMRREQKKTRRNLEFPKTSFILFTVSSPKDVKKTLFDYTKTKTFFVVKRGRFLNRWNGGIIVVVGRGEQQRLPDALTL